MEWFAQPNILYFDGTQPGIGILELACSAPGRAGSVGPWVRDSCILHIVTAGRAVFCGRPVGPGEAFLILPGAVHDFSFDADYRHMWISFTCRDTDALGAALGIRLRRQVYRVAQADRILAMWEAGFDACRAGAGEAMAASLLAAALPLLSAGDPAAPGMPMADRAAAYLRRNLHRPVTMEETAAHIGVSEKHLNRLFKRAYGVSLRQYLCAIRMERAQSLLRDRQYRIRDVALSAGYESQLAFSSTFRKKCGMSPSQWREQNP